MMPKAPAATTAHAVLDHHFRQRPEGTLLVAGDTRSELTGIYRMGAKGAYVVIDGSEVIEPGSNTAYPDVVADWLLEDPMSRSFRVIEVAL